MFDSSFGEASLGRMEVVTCLKSVAMLDLPALIERRLAAHKRHLDPTTGRRAAVLIPVSQNGDEQFVLLTRRTETVEHHKGQISFPGGAVEPGDPDLLSTAIRETREELGIPPDQIRILGVLDDVNSRTSGFVITPFVGQIPHNYPLTVSRAEIAEVLVVPLATFRDPRNLRVETVQRGGEQAEIFFYHYHRYEIWGLTAQIMKRMVDIVFAADGP